LKPKYDQPLSNFAFICKTRRYVKAGSLASKNLQEVGFDGGAKAPAVGEQAKVGSCTFMNPVLQAPGFCAEMLLGIRV
jgi:hypothetical protein